MAGSIGPYACDVHHSVTLLLGKRLLRLGGRFLRLLEQPHRRSPICRPGR